VKRTKSVAIEQVHTRDEMYKKYLMGPKISQTTWNSSCSGRLTIETIAEQKCTIDKKNTSVQKEFYLE